VTPDPTTERRRLRVRGVVQGVGFRPHVHRLATRHRLAGTVLNDGDGVVIDVEGGRSELDAFAAELVDDAPPLARIGSVSVEALATVGRERFEIVASEGRGATALVPPDVATCDDCLRELFDPSDRRYRYPFVNCTSCGPRFTIVTAVPYDRPNTTMAGFPLCDDCRREYEDPSDRRFHAEPIACPACGPTLSAPLEEAVAVLAGGGIVAVKGLGGYHLACDATDDAAVERLRARKRREEKPLAVMTGDPSALAALDSGERALLESAARPIVLARRRSGAPLAASVAPGSPWVGLLLPYTPLHHLLLHDVGRPLVMTSGNLTDEPIAIDDDDARRRLGDVADLVLSHDRSIHRRCEDSVVRQRFPIRRSRGLVPEPIELPVPSPVPLVAVGAQLKSTFCVVRGAEAFVSPHLGDLDGEAAFRAFRADLALYLDMLAVEPEAVACDLHPQYLSTRWAHDQGLPLVEVQHHHAHAAACLAEHGRTGSARALVLDGTGYGPDGTLWGGELLLADLAGYERLAWLDPVPLPGGEQAIREPWRVAAAYLERAGRPVPWARWPLVRQSLTVNAPLSSGAGRLFDAVAAVLGVRETVSYEGQAAIELEQLAADVPAQPYACRVRDGRIVGADLVAAVADDLVAGRPRSEIAAAFHEGLAEALVRACAAAESRHAGAVLLSGGSFQSLRLLDAVAGRLGSAGLEVLEHRRVPPNDAGISVGQAAVAAARMASCA
jgi:hydrogenase maturation protein HypF